MLNPNTLINKELLKKGKKQWDISGSLNIKKEKVCYWTYIN